MKLVPGFPDYGVTRSGKVWSVRRRKFLKPQNNGKGYLYVCLGRAARAYVHRLVAENYLGEVPRGSEVDHLDGDRSNNHMSNLRYLPRAENAGRRELTFRAIVEDIRSSTEISGRDLAAKHGLTESVVSKIRNYKSWLN